MPLPRPGRGAGKVSLAPPPHIHSSDPRKAGGWRQGEPLPASEPRTGGRGARGDPPSPQPAPTRLSRRRPSPPGAAPAAAAAPPTASCSAPDGRSRRAGPTCPERPQLGARPAPLPAPRGAPAGCGRRGGAGPGRGFPQTDARSRPWAAAGRKAAFPGRGGRRPWNGSWLLPRPPPGDRAPPPSAPRLSSARHRPGWAAATSRARLPAPSRARTQGATPAHLPSPALRPPALSPASPRSSLLGAGTPPLPAPHPGLAPLPSPSELLLE